MNHGFTINKFNIKNIFDINLRITYFFIKKIVFIFYIMFYNTIHF